MNKQTRTILTRVVEDAAEYFPAVDTPWSVVEEFINKHYAPKGWQVRRDVQGEVELIPDDPAKWKDVVPVFARPYKGRMVIVRSYTLQARESNEPTKV